MIKELTDSELTDNVKNNVDVANSLHELRARHSGIFYRKANAYSGVIEINDLKANPLTFFYEAAKQFDPEKSKFSTWVGNKTFWTCQSMLKSNKNFVEVQENHLVNFENLHQEGVLSFIENNMDDEEDKKILEKRLSGMTFSEISLDMNGKFSGEWIRQKYKRILDRYKKILDNE